MNHSNDQEDRILQLIRGSDSPIPIKRLSEHVLSSSGKKEAGLLQNTLLSLKTSGQIFEYPPERAGRGVRFGSVPPMDWLGNNIVTMVKEAGGRLTLRQVRESLRKWETPYFDETLGKLIKDGRLFYLTVRFKYVLSSPPDPSDHLLPRQVTALREILERINRHRKNALTIEELRTFLNGPNLAEALPVEASGQPSEDLLRAWYHKDLPRRGGLASVPIPWTWSHYESWCRSNKLRPDLEQFQGLMWSLHRTGKIELISHSMTQTLSDRESELSLKSQHGEVFYYWKWR
jgi:hypothetical protein